LHLQLRSGFRSGEMVIRTRDLQVGWPDKLLFSTRPISNCAAAIAPP
jgi:hypothetical protein